MSKSLFGSAFLLIGIAGSYLGLAANSNSPTKQLKNNVETSEMPVPKTTQVAVPPKEIEPSRDGRPVIESNHAETVQEGSRDLEAKPGFPLATVDKECASAPDPEASRQSSLMTSASTVQRRRIEADGMVEFEDDIVLSSLDSGRIDSMDVKEGTLVTVDQIICQLNQKQFENALRSAKAQVAIAKVDADSSLNLKTAETAVMYADRAVKRAIDETVFTEEERDQRNHEKARADHAVIQAKEEKLKSFQEFELRKTEAAIAKLRLEERSIKSPIKGMVISVDVNKGEWVNEGQPIVRIVSLDRVRISTSVSQENIDHIQLGDRATFYRKTKSTDPPVKYEGKVVFISPEVDMKLNAIRVFVEIESPRPVLRNHSSGIVVFGDSAER